MRTLLPVPAAAIGVTPGNPRFAYTADSYDFFTLDGDAFDSWAFFNPFTNTISTGAFEVVNPGDRTHVPFMVNATEWAATPALGLMIVTQDNRNGTDEANLVKVRCDREKLPTRLPICPDRQPSVFYTDRSESRSRRLANPHTLITDSLSQACQTLLPPVGHQITLSRRQAVLWAR